MEPEFGSSRYAGISVGEFSLADRAKCPKLSVDEFARNFVVSVMSDYTQNSERSSCLFVPHRNQIPAVGDFAEYELDGVFSV
jgi:hypothetical protein